MNKGVKKPDEIEFWKNEKTKLFESSKLPQSFQSLNGFERIYG